MVKCHCTSFYDTHMCTLCPMLLWLQRPVLQCGFYSINKCLLRRHVINMSFGSKWIKPQGESVSNKFLEGIKPQAPLKPRIEEAQKKLHMQISKLEAIASRMQEKDKLIFKRVVLAMQSHDSSHAKVLSGELSQIRKMNK